MEHSFFNGFERIERRLRIGMQEKEDITLSTGCAVIHLAGPIRSLGASPDDAAPFGESLTRRIGFTEDNLNPLR